MAVGDSPVAFSCVGIFPCPEVINTKFVIRKIYSS